MNCFYCGRPLGEQPGEHISATVYSNQRVEVFNSMVKRCPSCGLKNKVKP